MRIKVLKDTEELGKEAAQYCASILNKIIEQKGKARLLLSTGASQFDTLKHLVKLPVDWSKVEMFHLDEYVNLSMSHPASFRKYLQERFIELTNVGKAHFVSGEGDVEENIHQLTQEIRKEPIDLALIGIGENAHIAFNDPPADFETKEAYITVNLDEKCKTQQVNEGWFKTISDVPRKAISMTVYQIMQSEVIVSSVPYEVKANAIKLTLENELTNKVPATMLKEHKDYTLFLDKNSASLVDKCILEKYI
jgi:glucosamine-6-phosphate deaminase